MKKKILMMVEVEDRNDYPQEDLFDYFRYVLMDGVESPTEVDLSAIDVKGIRIFNVESEESPPLIDRGFRCGRRES